jgi:hypothetical protein
MLRRSAPRGAPEPVDVAYRAIPSPTEGSCGGQGSGMQDYLRELDDHILVAVQAMLEMISSLFA